MPRAKKPRPTICRQCQKDVGDPDQLSARRRCLQCSIGNAVDNMHQMAAGEGPRYEKYRENLIKAVTTGETQRKRAMDRKIERDTRNLVNEITDFLHDPQNPV